MKFARRVKKVGIDSARRLRVFAVYAIVVGLLTGCGTVATERFYTLADASIDAPPLISAGSDTRPAAPTIVISAITIPELIDRPQIVTRDGANRVNVSEQHLWAEPLKSAIGRVIAARLAQTLSSARVAAYPQSSIANPDLRVTIDVQRLDAVPGGEAFIETLWTVRRTSDDATRSGRTMARRAVDGVAYEDAVRAWSAALDDVVRAISVASSELVVATSRDTTPKQR